MFYLCGQVNVRQDLIDKKLASTIERYGCEFKRQILSEKFIMWLFRRYQTVEFTWQFYDSEPKFRDDIPYDDPWWDSEEGIEYQRRLCRENEDRRMTFNNWVDPIGPGIWGYTQREADHEAKRMLRSVLRWPVKKDGRIWFAKTQDMAFLYCYGRDFIGHDFWQIMKKRK